MIMVLYMYWMPRSVTVAGSLLSKTKNLDFLRKHKEEYTKLKKILPIKTV